MELNDELTQEIKDEIDGMTRTELARSFRFHPPGHYLHQGRAGQYFQHVFNQAGGWTPKLSKKIGWEPPS